MVSKEWKRIYEEIHGTKKMQELDKDRIRNDLIEWNKQLSQAYTILNKMNERMQEIYKELQRED